VDADMLKARRMGLVANDITVVVSVLGKEDSSAIHKWFIRVINNVVSVLLRQASKGVLI
jgi:hypothetical protein